MSLLDDPLIQKFLGIKKSIAMKEEEVLAYIASNIRQAERSAKEQEEQILHAIIYQTTNMSLVFGLILNCKIGEETNTTIKRLQFINPNIIPIITQHRLINSFSFKLIRQHELILQKLIENSTTKEILNKDFIIESTLNLFKVLKKSKLSIDKIDDILVHFVKLQLKEPKVLSIYIGEINQIACDIITKFFKITKQKPLLDTFNVYIKKSSKKLSEIGHVMKMGM
jgi:hypothetical protein